MVERIRKVLPGKVGVCVLCMFLRGKDGYIEGFLIVRGGDNYFWFDSTRFGSSTQFRAIYKSLVAYDVARCYSK